MRSGKGGLQTEWWDARHDPFVTGRQDNGDAQSALGDPAKLFVPPRIALQETEGPHAEHGRSQIWAGARDPPHLLKYYRDLGEGGPAVRRSVGGEDRVLLVPLCER